MAEIRLVYQQIRENIEQDIRKRKPGEFLHSEVQYSTLFKVSRPTVRKAIDGLVESGLVRRVPGKGLVVADPKEPRQGGTLLFLIPYVPGDGFFYNMVMGCVDAANRLGFHYRITNFTGAEERLAELQTFDLSEYAGVILVAYANSQDASLLELLERKQLPYVLVDNPVEGHDTGFVITDDFKGGYLGGEYLLSKGHEKILYLTLSGDNHTVRQREQGFLKALRDRGIELSADYLIPLKEDKDILDQLPFQGLDYTAIFGYSDLPVIMCQGQLAARGIKVPEDVSLIGYGNFKASEIMEVPLTTIAMPVYEMGFQAASMLIGHINGTETLKQLVLDITLLERSSVRAIDNG